MKKVTVIGSGYAGLSAACTLADKGFQVSIFEKNKMAGGRARKFTSGDFVFDMGPSWYWMPEVFENFFAQFGRKVSDYYELKRLDPSYEIVFGKDDIMSVPATMPELLTLFETIEKGSGSKLEKFLAEAQYKYEVGMKEFVYKPGNSVFEFMDIRVMKSAFKLQMFSSISRQIRKLFKNDKLIQLLEFPVLFLGAKPSDTPALYSLMNYADIKLGTWYPMGGMYKVIEGMVKMAKELGVNFYMESNVNRISVNEGKASGIVTDKGEYQSDYVVACGDYHHMEQVLLPEPYRHYNGRYWDKRKMAPSSLIFYIGLNRKIEGLHHHTLFFDESFERHSDQIYRDPQWPDKPLFYVCGPSVTDPAVAPEGCENLFILMPLAVDLQDNDDLREKSFTSICNRFEKSFKIDIRDHIVYKRSYCINDFKKDYNAFKGNAYGLANTLDQTAFLKPKMTSPKVSHLYFAGQLTTPGPGVPPSIISGQVAAGEIIKKENIC